MNVADRLLAIHIDATTNAAPLRRKRRPAVPTFALLAAALLMLVLAAWR